MAAVWQDQVHAALQLQNCTSLEPKGILTDWETGPGGSSVAGPVAWQQVCLCLRCVAACLLCMLLTGFSRVGCKSGLQGQCEICRTWKGDLSRRPCCACSITLPELAQPPDVSDSSRVLLEPSKLEQSCSAEVVQLNSWVQMERRTTEADTGN